MEGSGRVRRTGGGLGPGERGKGYSRRRGGLLPIRTFSLAHSRTDLAHVQRGGVWVPAAFDRRRDARERAPPDKASEVEIRAILLVYYWCPDHQDLPKMAHRSAPAAAAAAAAAATSTTTSTATFYC